MLWIYSSYEQQNPFDATNVHPENYELANKIIKDLNLKIQDIGTRKFIAKIENLQANEIAKKFKSEIDAVQSTLEALSKELFHDYRADIKIDQVFKKELVDIGSLRSNQIVTGVVMNICDFGAFVDIGVGQNGLIHTSAMRGGRLKVSDKVECKILNVDERKKRIGLQFIRNL